MTTISPSPSFLILHLHPSPSPLTSHLSPFTLTLTQALWAEVIAYQETGEEVDYEACLAALGQE